MRLLLLFVLIGTTLCFNGHSCPNPVFVRWPRVKLNFRAVSTGRLSLRACQSACSLGEDPVQPGKSLECAALNHHQSPDQFSHQCDVFQPHQLQNVDGFVEADDRFSFYWKYCVNTQRKCGGDYAFTYLSDRYMDANEVIRVRHTGSLEDCLSECLNEANFPCRSLSFNRTDGGCHLSANNQLTKPNAIKLNNNPNFRIDYYENNCYNLSESFKFSYECQEKGILVKIDSKFPYTGALYGLYDFFTCRIEPKEMTKFEYFFPSPTESKNCSDSIRYKGNDMVLEIVLSTDGVEPLYFITPDDMTFQAKCPISPKVAKVPQNNPINVQPQAPSTNDIDSDKFAASAHALFSLLSSENGSTKSTKRGETPTTKTTKPIVTPHMTKDTFPLLLTTTRLPSTIQPATTSKPAAATTNKHPLFKNTSPSLATTARHPPTPTRDPKGTSTHGVAMSTTVKSTTTSTRPPPTPTRTTSTVPHTTTTKTTPKPTTTQKSTTTKLPTTSKVTITTKATTTTKPTTTIKTTTSATTIKPTTTTKAPTTTKPATTTTKPSTVSSTTKATIVENKIVHNVPISSHPAPPAPQLINSLPVSMLNGAAPAQQRDSTPHPPSPQASTHNVARAPTQTSSDPVVVGPPGSHGGRAETVKNPVAFDVFHNGRVVEAVVVGSKITLDFTPHYPIPPRYMSVRGCQVEPIDSKYEWEKEPLPIIKDGCPADFVGLACQPRPTDHGVKVSIEAFRYQTTAHVQYTCLIRVCPFAECPESQCAAVEGCEAPSSLGVRARRSLSIEEIRRAIEADPKLQAQIGLPSLVGVPPNITVEQQLLALAGDHVVKRRLVVVNSEDQLKYYVRTGDLP